jgi:hypothetical protein
MLRRRGVPAVLYYGAAQDEGSGLYAHVWVRDEDIDVIGGENAYHFAVLATFPPQNPETVVTSPRAMGLAMMDLRDAKGWASDGQHYTATLSLSPRACITFRTVANSGFPSVESAL